MSAEACDDKIVGSGYKERHSTKIQVQKAVYNSSCKHYQYSSTYIPPVHKPVQIALETTAVQKTAQRTVQKVQKSD